jgi:predicted transcriptional regulator with HTH domain
MTDTETQKPRRERRKYFYVLQERFDDHSWKAVSSHTVKSDRPSRAKGLLEKMGLDTESPNRRIKNCGPC